MADRGILSERLEDNKAAAEWGRRQAELIKKGDELTIKLNQKYTPMILELERKRSSDLVEPSQNQNVSDF